MVRKVDSHFTIVLTPAPVGRFLEGYLTAGASGLKPGHALQIDVSEAEVGGRKFWEAYGGTSGHRKLIAILLENELIGKTCEDAIEDGQKIRMYVPIPGDELLVRVSATGTGTGDSQAVGAKLILANGGTFIATTGTPEAEPFEVMEAVDDVTSAGDLVHVIFTGN
jgi:hypothetical protein